MALHRDFRHDARAGAALRLAVRAAAARPIVTAGLRLFRGEPAPLRALAAADGVLRVAQRVQPVRGVGVLELHVRHLRHPPGGAPLRRDRRRRQLRRDRRTARCSGFFKNLRAFRALASFGSTARSHHSLHRDAGALGEGASPLRRSGTRAAARRLDPRRRASRPHLAFPAGDLRLPPLLHRALDRALLPAGDDREGGRARHGRAHAALRERRLGSKQLDSRPADRRPSRASPPSSARAGCSR